ncbi:MAG: restriction endonuclease subunit S [Tolumonas sp.]|nr:restriction endonuclease subunit S [Tolumonas sp.]
MGNNWPIYSLENICDGIFDCPHSTPELSSDGHYMVRTQDIRKGYFDTSDAVMVNSKVYKERTKRVTPKFGDLLFSREGTYFGDAAEVPENMSLCLGQRMVLIRPNPDIVSSKYLRIFINSETFQRKLLAFRDGTVAERLNLPVIRQLPIEVPPMQIQKVIEKKYCCLEEKELINRQINQTLEQMAQTLFKSWFVDFDPVIDNALDAGNEIPEPLQARAELRQTVRANQDFQPLPTDVWALFPAEFEESELGWVPKGWQCKDMTQLVDTVSITYPLKTVEKVIFLNTGDIENGRFLHCNYSSVDGLPGQAKKSIQKGDILFSEIRPQNKRFAFVNFDADHHVVSTKLMVLRAKDKIDPLLSYFILTLEKNTDELQRIAELRSGTFPQITYKELEMLGCVLPNNTELLDVFVSSYLKPIYSRNFALTDQNEQLAQLRDTLLPKLISGELRLDDLPDEVVTAANE